MYPYGISFAFDNSYVSKSAEQHMPFWTQRCLSYVRVLQCSSSTMQVHFVLFIGNSTTHAGSNVL